MEPPVETMPANASIRDAPAATSASQMSEKAAPGESPAPSIAEDFNPDWRFIVSFGSLAIITLMAALDATSISVALPIMARLLNGTAIEAFWTGTSFVLTSTVFQPPIGALSHIFGRKPMVYISLAFFGVGAIIAAVAKNFTTILAGRSLQGIGGGGIISLTEIIVTDLIPLRERGKWFSLLAVMWSLGTVIGPILGGGFAQNVTWRWIFWINLPFIGVGLVMIVAFLTINYQSGSFLAKLRRVDWVGTVVFIAAITGLLIPITWGGVTYPWDSWRTLVPLIVCAVALFGFVIYEEYIPAEPMIRTSVFKNRTAAATYYSTFVHGMILWCQMYYLPLYFEAVKGLNPIVTGVAMFPMTFTIAPSAGLTGWLIAKTGKYTWANWLGWVLATLGFGLICLIKVHTSTYGWILILLVPGFGTGILFTSMALTIQAASSDADQGYAANMFAFIRTFGNAVGVAIGGVTFQNAMKKKLLTFPTLASQASQLSANAAGLAASVKDLPDGLRKDQLLESYTYALRIVWIVCTALAASALFATLFVKSLPLDRELASEQGYKQKSTQPDSEKVSST